MIISFSNLAPEMRNHCTKYLDFQDGANYIATSKSARADLDKIPTIREIAFSFSIKMNPDIAIPKNIVVLEEGWGAAVGVPLEMTIKRAMSIFLIVRGNKNMPINLDELISKTPDIAFMQNLHAEDFLDENQGPNQLVQLDCNSKVTLGAVGFKGGSSYVDTNFL